MPISIQGIPDRKTRRRGRPVWLYYGQRDAVLKPAYNARRITPWIKTLAGVTMTPGAGHYFFLSSCSTQMTKAMPELCVDPAGVNRVAVHQQIDADALAFFRKTLGATQR